MAMCEISNGIITIGVDSHGAELRSLRTVSDGMEYMWSGDAAFWGRVSPVLFPQIGGLRDNSYTHKGKTYTMQKHGFARDMEFRLESQLATEIWFLAEADEQTKQEYPFDFQLEIGYRLEGCDVKVMWRVTNQSNETMYFSIGAHPAFKCPIVNSDKREDYYIEFSGANKACSSMIGTDGLLSGEIQEFALTDGALRIAPDLFEHDALILENSQTSQIALLTPDRKPYVSVAFDMPVVAVWTPTGGKAPFICIEPWYGLCDKFDFTGSLCERKWGNELSVGEEFYSEYTISVFK